MDHGQLAVLTRIAVALVLGGMIGFERTFHGRPAGFRTHSLVCVASALLMLVTVYQSEWMTSAPIDTIRTDPTRMAQGIMTGIGFLGAGVIFKEGLTVRGLTTAASIWMTAAIGILVGALTVGSATPWLIRGITGLPWRQTLLAASGLATLAAVVVVAFVREGPNRFPSARFDPRMALAVFRERGPRLACLGYFGHMWELYAMWAWIGLFLLESAHAANATGYGAMSPSTATFVVIALGALGCWVGGVVSDRWGRTAATIAAMGASALCAATIGLTFGGPPLLTLAVAVVWGVTVIADSAQFSTAITELSPAAYVGTALTMQTCVGFALTNISIWLLLPIVAAVGWRWAFATLAIGPALGVVAMARLRAAPEAVRLAGGRR